MFLSYARFDFLYLRSPGDIRGETLSICNSIPNSTTPLIESAVHSHPNMFPTTRFPLSSYITSGFWNLQGMQCVCRSPDWPGIASPHSNTARTPSRACSLVRDHNDFLKDAERAERIRRLRERYVIRVFDDEESLMDVIEGLHSKSFHCASGCRICIAEIAS